MRKNNLQQVCFFIILLASYITPAHAEFSFRFGAFQTVSPDYYCYKPGPVYFSTFYRPYIYSGYTPWYRNYPFLYSFSYIYPFFPSYYYSFYNYNSGYQYYYPYYTQRYYRPYSYWSYPEYYRKPDAYKKNTVKKPKQNIKITNITTNTFNTISINNDSVKKKSAPSYVIPHESTRPDNRTPVKYISIEKPASFKQNKQLSNTREYENNKIIIGKENKNSTVIEKRPANNIVQQKEIKLSSKKPENFRNEVQRNDNKNNYQKPAIISEKHKQISSFKNSKNDQKFARKNTQEPRSKDRVSFSRPGKNNKDNRMRAGWR